MLRCFFFKFLSRFPNVCTFVTGGSIIVQSPVIYGNGLISVNGGNGAWGTRSAGGGGSGGRIASILLLLIAKYSLLQTGVLVFVTTLSVMMERFTGFAHQICTVLEVRDRVHPVHLDILCMITCANDAHSGPYTFLLLRHVCPVRYLHLQSSFSDVE